MVVVGVPFKRVGAEKLFLFVREGVGVGVQREVADPANEASLRIRWERAGGGGSVGLDGWRFANPVAEIGGTLGEIAHPPFTREGDLHRCFEMKNGGVEKRGRISRIGECFPFFGIGNTVFVLVASRSSRSGGVAGFPNVADSVAVVIESGEIPGKKTGCEEEVLHCREGMLASGELVGSGSELDEIVTGKGEFSGGVGRDGGLVEEGPVVVSLPVNGNATV